MNEDRSVYTMKNNLFKTIAVTAITVAMLTTTVTSFAATASTLTTYNETSQKPHVVSTVSGVEKGVMVTYLASVNGTVEKEADIVYINQVESDGGTIKFEYDALTSNTAQILYGSVDPDVAAGLRVYANQTVSAAGVTITTDAGVDSYEVKDSELNIIDYPYTLGNTEDGFLTVNVKEGYELSSVKIDGDEQELTVGGFTVKAGNVVEIKTVNTSSPVAITSVAVDSADFNAVVTAEGNELEYRYLLCQITGDVSEVTEYGVYATKAGEAFELDPEEPTGGYYKSLGVTDGYYAVLLAAEDMSDVTLVPYWK